MCEHGGFWSCVSSYDRARKRLAHTMVCDACGQPLRRIGEQGYEPRPLLGAAATVVPCAAPLVR